MKRKLNIYVFNVMLKLCSFIKVYILMIIFVSVWSIFNFLRKYFWKRPDPKMSLIKELEVLKENEKEVTSLLQEVDLVAFGVELYRYGAISKEIKEEFTNLDHTSLESEIKISYLLQHVYDKLKVDNNVFYNSLQVFCKFGENMKRMGERLLNCLRIYEEDVDDLDTREGVEGGTKIGTKRSRSASNYCLTECDVCILTELLNDVSYRWEEISIALGLSKSEMEDCRDRKNAVSLNNVLKRWLTAKCADNPYRNDHLVTRLSQAC